jgi:hypothetical protein
VQPERRVRGRGLAAAVGVKSSQCALAGCAACGFDSFDPSEGPSTNDRAVPVHHPRLIKNEPHHSIKQRGRRGHSTHRQLQR